MELGHPGVQTHEPAVVVAGVPVVAPDPAPLGEQIVVRRDQAALGGHDDLRRREAEHLGVAEPADLRAAVRRAERVGRVEEEPEAVALRDVAQSPRRRTACRRCASRGSRTCAPRSPARPNPGRASAVPGRCRRTTGRRPFQSTAWAVAANVNDGTITSPESSDARSTSISPVVHDATAMQCRTPR